MRALFLFFLISITFSAHAGETVCKQAGARLKSAIPEWIAALTEYNALHKHKMVLKIRDQIRTGSFDMYFANKCQSDYQKYKDVYTCLAGISSWTGAASCTHPNHAHGWSY